MFFIPKLFQGSCNEMNVSIAASTPCRLIKKVGGWHHKTKTEKQNEEIPQLWGITYIPQGSGLCAMPKYEVDIYVHIHHVHIVCTYNVYVHRSVQYLTSSDPHHAWCRPIFNSSRFGWNFTMFHAQQLLPIAENAWSKHASKACLEPWDVPAWMCCKWQHVCMHARMMCCHARY